VRIKTVELSKIILIIKLTAVKEEDEWQGLDAKHRWIGKALWK